MVIFGLNIVDMAVMLLRVLQYIKVLQYIQVLQYMLLRVLQYIEGLLGYVTFLCCQNFGISRI